MKEIKILHLFPRLLSLYGEYGNVAVLEKFLKEAGHSVTVTGWEKGELDLSGFVFIYVGSGTEDNLLEAVKRLAPHADAIAASIPQNGWNTHMSGRRERSNLAWLQQSPEWKSVKSPICTSKVVV